LGDILLGLLVSFWILFVILVVERHQIPAILIKWLLCHGTLYFLRIVTISVTALPVTQNHCREHYTRIGNMMWNTLLGIVSMGSLNQHCGDLLFSGHSVLITLVCLLFTDYCKRLGRDKFYDLVVLIIRFIVYSLALVACLFIIATRNHYTVDVVIGVYATFVTYKVMPDHWPFPPFK
jgi:shingomyelin synthase